MNLSGITAINISVFGVTFSIATVIIMLITLTIFVYSLLLSLSPRADMLSCFVLLSLMFFFAFRDVWEHHYVMLIPFLVLMLCTERLSLPVALLIYALIATPTAFPFLNFPRGINLLHQLHIYSLVYHLHFLIKQTGVIIFFWQVLRAINRMKHNFTDTQLHAR